MTRTTLVSIWHDRRSLVERSLGSALQQSLPDVDHLIVDDGSSDGTLERIREVVSRHGRGAVEVRSQPNLGFTASLVRHLADVRTDYVALLDAGDVMAPTRLERQVALADAIPGSVAIGCHVGTFGKDGDPDGPLGDASRRPERVGRGEAGTDVPRTGTHGATLLRTEALHEVGGYRRAFRRSQDSDLLLRLNRIGSTEIVAELLYWRFVGPTTLSHGSVAGRLSQARYGELALQCAEARERGEPDLVDRYGEDAVELIRATRRHRRRLRGIARSADRAGDHDAARRIRRLAAMTVRG